MPFSFDHSEPHAASEINSASAESIPQSDNFEGALPDFSDLDNELPIEDTTLESVDFSNKNFDDNTNSDVIGTESPDLNSDSEIQTDTTTILNEPDSEIQTDSTSILDESDSKAKDIGDDFSGGSFSLPDFEDFDTSIGTNNSSEDSTMGADLDDSFSTPEPESLDLPDFDLPIPDTNSNSTTGINFDDFDDFDSNFDSTSDSDSFSSSGTSAGGAMDFSDLYDKETVAGEHATLYDEEEENKKTRAPVVICIICAIICVIATVLLLFIVPSKYNLIASRNTNGVSLIDKLLRRETSVEKPVEEKAQPESKEEEKYLEVVVEEPKEEEGAPEAVEDKIIIAPEPEKVVPLPPPVPVEEKRLEKRSSDVKYHIKWGDTLWDISESYYKTPWKYPKIADYNKIKNPDLIISGTDILIPSE